MLFNHQRIEKQLNRVELSNKFGRTERVEMIGLIKEGSEKINLSKYPFLNLFSKCFFTKSSIILSMPIDNSFCNCNMFSLKSGILSCACSNIREIACCNTSGDKYVRDDITVRKGNMQCGEMQVKLQNRVSGILKC